MGIVNQVDMLRQGMADGSLSERLHGRGAPMLLASEAGRGDKYAVDALSRPHDPAWASGPPASPSPFGRAAGARHAAPHASAPRTAASPSSASA